jgi:2-polyprenyl-3-methyl-5-hydroxy-6-metoxy-1,4-benzoquinol methylase
MLGVDPSKEHHGTEIRHRWYKSVTDFRAHLYSQYVTKFTRVDAQPSDKDLSAYWVWCRYKYLPLLKELQYNDSILEIGCGPGYFLEFLRMVGFMNVKGIDISEEQITIASAKKLDVEKANIYDYLQNKKEFFNAIIAIDILEHFTKDELLNIVKFLYNSLKTGGILIIQTPNGQGLFPNQIIYGDLTHLTIFNPGSLQQLLLLYGFHNIKFVETGPVGKDIKGKVRLVLWKFIKFIINAIRMIETSKSQEIWTENMICYCQKAANQNQVSTQGKL